MMDLVDLVAALEAAPGPSHELDGLIAKYLFGHDPGPARFSGDGIFQRWLGTAPAYTSDFNATANAIRGRWDTSWRSTRSSPTESAASLATLTQRKWQHGLVARPDAEALALCIAAAKMARAEAGTGSGTVASGSEPR